MMDLEASLSASLVVMVGFCAVTMAEEEVCLILSEHQQHVGCNRNGGCVKEEIPGLAGGYTQRVLTS